MTDQSKHSSDIPDTSRRGSSASRSHRLKTGNPPGGTPTEKKSVLRRGAWLCLALTGILLLLVVLAPTLIARPRVRDYLLSRFVPAELGLITVSSLRCGWTCPFQLEGLKVIDHQGSPLFDVQQLSLNRSLGAIILDRGDLGRLEIAQPTLHLILRPDGSNLEDWIGRLPVAEAHADTTKSSNFAPPAMEVVVTGGKVLASEAASNLSWQTDFESQVTVPRSTDEHIVATLRGALERQPWFVQWTGSLEPTSATWPIGPEGELRVQADELPLGPLHYAAQRAGQKIAALAGRFSVELEGTWLPDRARPDAPLPQFHASVQARVADLQIDAPELIGSDSLTLANATWNGQLTLANNVISVNQCELSSDFGQATLETQVPIEQLASETSTSVEALQELTFSTRGEIDVAAIAKTLPGLLKVREGLQLESGKLAWTAASDHTEGQPQHWSGRLQTQEVSVFQDGQPLRWDFPCDATFSLTHTDTWRLDEVAAKSDFFWLKGRGQLNLGSIQGEINLRTFLAQLGQVFDLDPLQAQGTMQLAAEWSEPKEENAPGSQPNRVELRMQTRLQNFELSLHEQLICREEALTVGAKLIASLTSTSLATAGQGLPTPGTISSVESAHIRVDSGGDLLFAELQAPIDLSAMNDTTWPVACRLQGNLAHWLARIELAGIDTGWKVAGDIDATVRSRVGIQETFVDTLTAYVSAFQATGNGVSLNEPDVQLETTGHVDHRTFSVRVPKLTLVSHSLSLLAQEIAVQISPSLSVSGDVGYRGNLTRLVSCIPAAVGTTTFSGEVVGKATFQATDDVTQFRIGGDISDLRVTQVATNPRLSVPASSASEMWYEPKLSWNVDGLYRASEDEVQVTRADVAGKVVGLHAHGGLKRVSTKPSVEMSGQWEYDLEGLVAILRDTLGPDVQLSGKHQEQFALKGPLSPRPGELERGFRVDSDLVAQFGLAWSGIDLYHIPLSASRLDGQLADGVLQLKPIDMLIGEGRVQLSPTLHVNTAPLWMTIAPGPLAQQVRLSPEMVGSWMRYVTPLLGDATAVEGTFSVQLARAEIPLMQPFDGRLEGELSIHGGAMGPGPLANQFLEIATQIKQLIGKGSSRIADPERAWVELQPQTIRFQLAEQRVYHEGFEMVIDNVAIRTRGSVGLDNTLSMEAEVPILDEWVQSEPALAGLRGQIIRLPLTGTVSQPQLDRRAFQQVTGNLVQQAARGYVEKELGNQLQKQLDKLFR